MCIPYCDTLKSPAPGFAKTAHQARMAWKRRRGLGRRRGNQTKRGRTAAHPPTARTRASRGGGGWEKKNRGAQIPVFPDQSPGQKQALAQSGMILEFGATHLFLLLPLLLLVVVAVSEWRPRPLACRLPSLPSPAP